MVCVGISWDLVGALGMGWGLCFLFQPEGDPQHGTARLRHDDMAQHSGLRRVLLVLVGSCLCFFVPCLRHPRPTCAAQHSTA